MQKYKKGDMVSALITVNTYGETLLNHNVPILAYDAMYNKYLVVTQHHGKKWVHYKDINIGKKLDMRFIQTPRAKIISEKSIYYGCVGELVKVVGGWSYIKLSNMTLRLLSENVQLLDTDVDKKVGKPVTTALPYILLYSDSVTTKDIVTDMQSAEGLDAGEGIEGAMLYLSDNFDDVLTTALDLAKNWNFVTIIKPDGSVMTTASEFVNYAV